MTLDLRDLSNEDFCIEHLSGSKKHRRLISTFSAPNNAIGLEIYLKKHAIRDERRKESRTYLVTDAVSGELACYFSLRAGLIAIREDDEGFYTIPAVELSNFASSAIYRASSAKIAKIGAYIFDRFVLPIVRDTAGWIGIRCLYVYALPFEKLIAYYGKLGFSRLPEDAERFVHEHMKPLYDRDCVFMYQDVGNG